MDKVTTGTLLLVKQQKNKKKKNYMRYTRVVTAYMYMHGSRGGGIQTSLPLPLENFNL